MSVAEAGFDVEADTRTNTLYLELSGTLSTAQIKQAAAEALTSARHLSEGFDVITDISAFTPPSPEAAKPIEDAQSELTQMGVGDVVRVVPTETSAVTESAFERRSRGAGDDVETAASVAEAERLLH